MQGTWTVYILRCADNSFYVGCTNDFEKRLVRHNKDEVVYTGTRLPLKPETKIIFTDKYLAYNFEKYLKSGSGRAFMYKRLVKK
jgi:putative endonuclease